MSQAATMNRRIFLRGVAGAALAAPLLTTLGPLRARAQTKAPTRVIIFYTNNGVLTNRWFPTVENGPIDANALAGTLKPLAPFAPKLLFPRGLGMYPRGAYMVNGKSYFDPHDQGMGSKLTCAPLDPDGSHWAMGRSFDHIAAELVNPGAKTPLVLSVGASVAMAKSIVSFSAPGTPYPPETNPRNVYSRLTGLFQGGTAAPSSEGDYRVRQGKSIIDLVRGDLDTFKRLNMSGADRKKVDDWLGLLRETETAVVSSTCDPNNATALGIDANTVNQSGGGFGFDMGTAFTKGGDMMIQLMALTTICDANRVSMIHWPGFATFTWDGMAHKYDHHGLSHRNGSFMIGGTCLEGVIENIQQIDSWYTGRYLKLVSLFDSVKEGDGTLLDHSAVIWLPELADGNVHNNNNLPIVIAGSMGGYFKQGVSVNVEGGRALGTGNSEASCTNGVTDIGYGTGSLGGNVPINKLYVTLLNGLGAKDNGGPVTRFGVADTNSLEAGVTNPGELTALRA